MLHLAYKPSPAAATEADPESFEELYLSTLEQFRSRDLSLGYGSVGPHRDDLLVELDGVDLRRFGSAGQVRAAMVALKLAKLCLLQQDRGESPLFLMDDVDTDLDEVRAAAVAEFLQQESFQAVVATSKVDLVKRLGFGFMEVRMDGGTARAA